MEKQVDIGTEVASRLTELVRAGVAAPIIIHGEGGRQISAGVCIYDHLSHDNSVMVIGSSGEEAFTFKYQTDEDLRASPAGRHSREEVKRLLLMGEPIQFKDTYYNPENNYGVGVSLMRYLPFSFEVTERGPEAVSRLASYLEHQRRWREETAADRHQTQTAVLNALRGNGSSGN